VKSAMEQEQPKFRPPNTKPHSSALRLHAQLGRANAPEDTAENVHCMNQGKTLPLFSAEERL